MHQHQLLVPGLALVSLLPALVVTAQPQRPAHCTEAQRQRSAAFANVNRHPQTNCPKTLWLDTVARNASACALPGSVRVLAIGGNKGYDCVGWLRFFSTSEADPNDWRPTAREWRSGLPGHGCGGCNNCGTSPDPFPVPKRRLSQDPPVVTCVEPLPVNFAALAQAARQGPWAAAGLRVVQAAVVLDSTNQPSAAFTSAKRFGFERASVLGLGMGPRRQQQQQQHHHQHSN